MMNSDYPRAQTAGEFMYAVYAWMAAALGVTAITAYAVATTPKIFMFVHHNPPVLIGIFLLQIGLVVGLSAALNRLSLTAAITLFFLYAFSVGVTFSALLYVYDWGSVVTAFVTTAGMFGGMAVYGYFTRADLTAIGNIGLMVLWGLVVALLVNMWFKNSTFDYIISGVGVVFFSLLTAYDTQKLKHVGQSMIADQETVAKIAIIGALTLYLDFINLFLYLLRFMGKQRND